MLTKVVGYFVPRDAHQPRAERASMKTFNAFKCGRKGLRRDVFGILAAAGTKERKAIDCIDVAAVKRGKCIDIVVRPRGQHLVWQLQV